MKAPLSQAVDQTCAVIASFASACDATATFPIDALDAMRTTGLLGLLVPAEFGGMNGNLDDLVDVTMELGRADLSAALIFAMHCQQVGVLDRYGALSQREKILPPIANGEMYLGSITTSPGTGGHLLTQDSAARTVDGELRIDRRAPIVTGGNHADAFLVTMGTPEATWPGQVDLIFVHRHQVDLQVLGDWSPLGMRATESVPMVIAGSVPKDQVIGRSGCFSEMATDYFAPLAHIGWSSAWLGTATGALSRVLNLIRDPEHRHHFDPRSELLLTRLASVRGRLEIVYSVLTRSVAAIAGTIPASNPSVQMLVNTLKLSASEECVRAVDDLIELVGLRHGYLTGSTLRLERALRDLRSASLNYANDRLHVSNGALTLMDSRVHFG